MRFLTAFLFIGNLCFSQSLTVEKIMQDPKWIGTSPSGVFWGPDSKTIYFSWNPNKNVSDSTYKYIIGGKEPVKAGYLDALVVNAGANGIYNVTYTLMAYVYRGDVFLNNIKTGVTTRVTQTEDFETNPRFIMKDEWLVYNRNQNLYA